MPRATKTCAQLLSPTEGPANRYSEATTVYCNYCVLQLQAATTEAHVPRTLALQQEKPPQCETCAPPRREVPDLHN